LSKGTITSIVQHGVRIGKADIIATTQHIASLCRKNAPDVRVANLQKCRNLNNSVQLYRQYVVHRIELALSFFFILRHQSSCYRKAISIRKMYNVTKPISTNCCQSRPRSISTRLIPIFRCGRSMQTGFGIKQVLQICNFSFSYHGLPEVLTLISL
jgi:hypothetical protein